MRAYRLSSRILFGLCVLVKCVCACVCVCPCVCVRCEHPCMRLHCITNLYLIFTTTDNQSLSTGGRYIAIKGHLAKDIGGQRLLLIDFLLRNWQTGAWLFSHGWPHVPLDRQTQNMAMYKCCWNEMAAGWFRNTEHNAGHLCCKPSSTRNPFWATDKVY